MRMKKLVSVVAAVAVTAAFCVPAYAATPGEEANGLAQSILALNLTAENWNTQKAAAGKSMEDMTTAVRNDSTITVTQEMNNAALAYFDAAESNGDSDFSKEEPVPAYNGVSMVYRKDASASDLTVNGFKYDDKGVITLDATEGATPSEDGYAVSITVPAEGNNNYYYTVSINDGQKFTVTVPVTSYVDESGRQVYLISFWAPHFTTYSITPVNASQGNGNPTGNSGNPSNNSSEVTTSSDDSTTATTNTTSTTTAAVTENPIKATGVSMDLSAFAVVACAAVVACGAGVAVKKSRKGE